MPFPDQALNLVPLQFGDDRTEIGVAGRIANGDGFGRLLWRMATISAWRPRGTSMRLGALQDWPLLDIMF